MNQAVYEKYYAEAVSLEGAARTLLAVAHNEEHFVVGTRFEAECADALEGHAINADEEMMDSPMAYEDYPTWLRDRSRALQKAVEERVNYIKLMGGQIPGFPQPIDEAQSREGLNLATRLGLFDDDDVK